MPRGCVAPSFYSPTDKTNREALVAAFPGGCYDLVFHDPC